MNLLLWAKNVAPHVCFYQQILGYVNKYPTRCNYTQVTLSENCSTCFGWFFLPSTGAQITVSTASDTGQPLLLPAGIVEALSLNSSTLAKGRYNGRLLPDAVDTIIHANQSQLLHNCGRQQQPLTSTRCCRHNYTRQSLSTLPQQRQVATTFHQYQMLQIQLFVLLMMEWRNHPKHVEQFTDKINCVQSHLVGHLLTYNCDARSHKHKINRFWTLNRQLQLVTAASSR